MKYKPFIRDHHINIMEFETIPLEKDILPELPWKIENSENPNNQRVQIFYFALTTCAYCKKGLEWLRERKAKFSWLHLDEMPVEKKVPIKEWVKKKYNTNFGTPFTIFRLDGKDTPSEGFDPDYWKAKIR